MDTHLYTVDQSGRVWFLDTFSQPGSKSQDPGSRSNSFCSSSGQYSSPGSTPRNPRWTLLPNPTKIDIKRVSASRNGIIWAISSDHQLHYYVLRQDIPIRVREELWENQRWNPISNWSSSSLLPTDRPRFSNEEGTQAKSKDSIKLPPLWTWEADPGDWAIETVFGTTLLESEGWTYAIDFPATYHAQKSWTSCVRRRKWWRIRKFTGFNQWIPIPPIHPGDHTAEPFTDISVGSFGPHEKELISVWSLTVLGQCWLRTGVSYSLNPEGKSWELVEIPKGLEACQISVSGNGIPFVVTWTGSLLFRTGLTPRCLEGTQWIEKNGPPGGLMHVSAGTQTLWAVTRDRSCWVLKNNLLEALGTAAFEWKSIPGKIRCISVSKNDMVILALNDDTNELMTRFGVSFPDNKHGQGWKEVVSSAAAGNWDTVSNVSSGTESGVDELDSLSMNSIRPDFPEDFGNTGDTHQGTGGPSSFCWVDGGCLSSGVRLLFSGSGLGEENDIEIGPWRNEILSGIQKMNVKTSQGFDGGKYPNAIEQSEYEKAWKTKSTLAAKMLEHSQGQGISWNKGTLEVLNNDTIVFHKNLNHTWIGSLGDVVSIFKVREISSSFTLRIRNPIIGEGHADFVSFKFGNDQELSEWYDLLLSLTHKNLDELATIGNIWLTTTNGEVHNCGMLKILDEPIGSADLDLSSTTDSSNNEYPLLKGFLPGTKLTVDISIPSDPPPESFRFNLMGRAGLVAFHFNPRFEQNHGGVIVRNSKINEIWGPEERDGPFPFCPGKKYTLTIESTETHLLTTVHINEFKQKKHFTTSFKHRVQPKFIIRFIMSGDVHVLGIRYDPKSSEDFLQPEFVSRPIPGHFWKIESAPNGSCWGIGFDGNVWISLATAFKKSKNFEGDSSASLTFTDSQSVVIYENERWNPVGGWCSQLLPTDRSHWSDESGRTPLEKDTVKLPSGDWHWENDWEIDYSPGDEGGWEYAIDFPASYHKSKRLNDFVRRRRWKRICEFRVKGPWSHVQGVKLVDLSIQVNEDCDLEVLGVRDNGECVLRSGISPETPAGTHWESIADDVRLISISGHFGHKAWAIGKNGFAYIRYRKWQMLDRPKETPLKSISVGPNGIWAVGTNHSLYRRTDVQIPILPEGKEWTKVCDGVAQISQGLGNELWALLKLGKAWNCTIARRDGISGNHPNGIGWTSVAEGPWHYLSVTGAYKRNR